MTRKRVPPSRPPSRHGTFPKTLPHADFTAGDASGKHLGRQVNFSKRTLFWDNSRRELHALLNLGEDGPGASPKELLEFLLGQNLVKLDVDLQVGGGVSDEEHQRAVAALEEVIRAKEEVISTMESEAARQAKEHKVDVERREKANEALHFQLEELVRLLKDAVGRIAESKLTNELRPFL